MAFDATSSLNQINVTQTFISVLNQYYVFTLILPFFLIFSIIYMLADYTNILKIDKDDEQGRKITIVFSIAFSLMAIENQTVMEYLLNFLPNASFVILSILLFIMVISLYKQDKNIPGWIKGMAMLTVVLVMLILALAGMGIGLSGSGISVGNLIEQIINSVVFWIIILFIIFIIVIIWMVTPSKSASGESSATSEAAAAAKAASEATESTKK